MVLKNKTLEKALFENISQKKVLLLINLKLILTQKELIIF